VSGQLHAPTVLHPRRELSLSLGVPHSPYGLCGEETSCTVGSRTLAVHNVLCSLSLYRCFNVIWYKNRLKFHIPLQCPMYWTLCVRTQNAQLTRWNGFISGTVVQDISSNSCSQGPIVLSLNSFPTAFRPLPLRLIINYPPIFTQVSPQVTSGFSTKIVMHFQPIHTLPVLSSLICSITVWSILQSALVKALCYKSEGHGFDTRWGGF
jgi:hypothetical protein